MKLNIKFGNIPFVCFMSLCFILLASCDNPSSGSGDDGFQLDKYELKFKEVISAKDLPMLPTNFAFTPDEDQMIIIGQAGSVRAYELQLGNEDQEDWILMGGFEIEEVLPIEGGIGLTGLAIDPNFKNNSTFYVSYSTGDNLNEKIIAYSWKENFEETQGTAKTIMDFRRVRTNLFVHGLTSIEFGEGRHMYVSVGESNKPDTAQSPEYLNGKLLKIIPHPTGGYSIPETNPYVGNDTILDEIVAFGLRSPFRASTFQDYVFIGDVGHKSFEEVNLYRPEVRNFGWPICEGPCGDTLEPQVIAGLDEPLIAYERSGDFAFEDEDVINTTRASVAVGPYLYVDNLTQGQIDENPLLNFHEHLIFFDVLIGFIRAVPIPRSELETIESPESFNLGHFEYMTSMRQNSQGEIYITRIADNSYNIEQPSWMKMELVLKEEYQ